MERQEYRGLGNFINIWAKCYNDIWGSPFINVKNIISEDL